MPPLYQTGQVIDARPYLWLNTLKNKTSKKGVFVTEPIQHTQKYRFGAGVGLGLIVFVAVAILSSVISGIFYAPIAIIGFISGIIFPIVKSWPSAVSFAGGHFVIQWLAYTLARLDNWQTSLVYALVGTACCLLGQLVLQGKKKKHP